MRTPSSWKNSSSLCASFGGCTAWWCHWSIRWVWVNVPDFSTWLAAGKKKTSVSMSSVRSSPLAISGESFQKVADSMSWKSRTTTHLRCVIASRCILPWAEPTAGFCPSTK